MMNENNSFLTESRFYMWRAIFSVAHSDGIVTLEETDFLSKCLERDDFSDGQRQILVRDLAQPQDIQKMFKFVSVEEDKLDFFILAEELGGSDGDFCGLEKKTINKLKKENLLGFSPSYLQEKILERKVTRAPSD